MRGPKLRAQIMVRLHGALRMLEYWCIKRVLIMKPSDKSAKIFSFHLTLPPRSTNQDGKSLTVIRIVQDDLKS